MMITRKLFLIPVLIGILLLTGCGESPNVKKVEEVGEEKVVILKDNKENMIESVNPGPEVQSIKRLTEAEFAFYLYTGDILIGRKIEKKAEEIDERAQIDEYVKFYIYDPEAGEEELFDPDNNGKYFQISPERKKLLFVNENFVYMYDIEKSFQREKPGIIYWKMNPYLEKEEIEWMNKSNVFLHLSVTWADENSYMYSDLDGNIYVRNIPEKWTKTFVLDSPLKLNLSYIDIKAVYLKNSGYKEMEVEPNQTGYDLFLESQTNYSLGFSKKDNHNDIIIENSDNLNIKDYWLSPDLKRLALYFEDNENNGLLALADIEGYPFIPRLKYDQLIQLSNKRVREFAWSREGKRLAYVTDEQHPSLYIADYAGQYNKQITTNKNFYRLDWNDNGNTLLAIERKSEQSNLYQIKLKDEAD